MLNVSPILASQLHVIWFQSGFAELLVRVAISKISARINLKYILCQITGFTILPRFFEFWFVGTNKNIEIKIHPTWTYTIG